MEKKITAIFIIEMLGRPSDYVISTLNELIEKLGKEEGVKIIEKKIHEPKKVENSDLFTTFAEIEAEFDTMMNALWMAFTYMPSHFEIISPEEIKIKNSEISELITQTILKLHKYDELAKKMVTDNAILETKLKEITAYIQQAQSLKVVENKEEIDKFQNKSGLKEKKLKSKKNGK